VKSIAIMVNAQCQVPDTIQRRLVVHGSATEVLCGVYDQVDKSGKGGYVGTCRGSDPEGRLSALVGGW
jgi:hypothetical protein